MAITPTVLRAFHTAQFDLLEDWRSSSNNAVVQIQGRGPFSIQRPVSSAPMTTQGMLGAASSPFGFVRSTPVQNVAESADRFLVGAS